MRRLMSRAIAKRAPLAKCGEESAGGAYVKKKAASGISAEPMNPRDAPEAAQSFDVTDTWCQACLILLCPCTCVACVPGVLGTKRLVLEPEEAVFTSDCSLGCHEVTRMPYGELGNVKESKVCCCIGFSSNLTASDTGSNSTIVPGNCCETTLVGAIVHELKRRMKSRGDTGNIRRVEDNARQLRYLHTKVDAIMENLQIASVPVPLEMEERK